MMITMELVDKNESTIDEGFHILVGHHQGFASLRTTRRSALAQLTNARSRTRLADPHQVQQQFLFVIMLIAATMTMGRCTTHMWTHRTSPTGFVVAAWSPRMISCRYRPTPSGGWATMRWGGSTIASTTTATTTRTPLSSTTTTSTMMATQTIQWRPITSSSSLHQKWRGGSSCNRGSTGVLFMLPSSSTSSAAAASSSHHARINTTRMSTTTTSTTLRTRLDATPATQTTSDLSEVESEENFSTISTSTTLTPVSSRPHQLESPSSSSATTLLAGDHEFIRPDRDDRHYRVIRLSNNLECLLVSDGIAPGAVGTEAAAVHIQAGHFDDTIAGLAHFNEHMVFLGSAKYPAEDAYESFLTQYGGFSNAYTDMEDTNYFFSVTTQKPDVEQGDESTNNNINDTDHPTSAALVGGLDRLAQFFIAPTFNRDAVDRELRSIDSEHKSSINSDMWRHFQLIKSTCNPSHPFAKFGCGNYDTLMAHGSERLLEELRNFWSTYYQTYNLRLAVIGHASLDQLQMAVEQTFGQLPSSAGHPRRVKANPDQVFTRENAVYGVQAYGPEQLGQIRHVIPYAEQRTLKVYFATPPLDDPALVGCKPERVLSHILGHETAGSLHAVLTDMGYATDLSSGMAIDASDFSLFCLTVVLTPEGMRQYHSVLDLIFQWITLLKEHQNDLHGYHDELRQLYATNFRFRENGDPVDFCSSAASVLFDETMPPNKLLVHSTEMTDYNETITGAFLERFRPEHCFISIISSDWNQTDGDWQTEPWYGAQYQIHSMTDEQKDAWEFPKSRDPRLQLPALNAYIPTDFSLRCDDDDDGAAAAAANMDNSSTLTKEDLIRKPPSLLVERPNLRLWHKMDHIWKVPRTYIRMSILSAAVYQTPRSMTYNRIYQRVLNDELTRFVYDASVVGCHYRVSCVPNGWRISVRGYSEKVLLLLEQVTERIWSLMDEMRTTTLEFNPALQQRFEIAKEGLLRETKNYRLDSPHEINSYNSRLFLEENVWYIDNYVNEMEGPESLRHPLTMHECANVVADSLSGRVKVEALCMGNINVQGAQDVEQMIQNRFLDKARTLTEVETPSFRSLKLPTRDEACMIFGPVPGQRPVPLIYQEWAFTSTEENNAVDLILQVGSELDLGYRGMAVLDLICHMADPSAYKQLRTQEQLGYIVNAYARKTAGSAWGMSVVIQSNSALPELLQERCEAWLETFRKELEEMDPKDLAQEASAVVAQLQEVETKLSQEVGRTWGEILSTEGLMDRMRTPCFDRFDMLSRELTVHEFDLEDGNRDRVEVGDGMKDLPNTPTIPSSGFQTAADLKAYILDFFDRHLTAASPHRRAMSAHVYKHAAKDAFDAAQGQPGILSSYADMRHVKQYLSSWPCVPYWRIDNLLNSTKSFEASLSLPSSSSEEQNAR